MECLIPEVVMSNTYGGLFLEIPVSSDSAPYLVSKSRGFLWLNRSHKGNIRSAILPGDCDESKFVEVVREVQSHGSELQWGNTFPQSQEGLLEALRYMRFYGHEEMEVLTSDNTLDVPDTGLAPWDGVTKVLCPWVPPMCSVVVPQDRTYLGMVGKLKDSHTFIVHNPARGMAILGTW